MPDIPALPPPSPFDSLPRWQRRLVWLVNGGAKLYDACVIVGCSMDSAARYADASPAFAQALKDAELKNAIAGPNVAEIKEIAIAHAGRIVEHMGAQATDPAVKHRDQQGAGRLVLESAGVIGPQNAVTVEVKQQTLNLLRTLGEAAKVQVPGTEVQVPSTPAPVREDAP